MIILRKKPEPETPPAPKAESKRSEDKPARAKDKPGADGEESQDRPRK